MKEIFSKLEYLINNEYITDYSVSQNTLDNVFVNFVRDQCDTLQQVKLTSQRKLGHSNDIIDDTFDDGSFVVTRSTSNENGNVSLTRMPMNVACSCKTNTQSLEVLECSKL